MADHHRDHLGACSALLFSLAAFFFSLCVYANWNVESFWVIPLFALPLLVQAAGLVVLYFKPRKENPQITIFFILYLFTTFFSVASYCSLWLLYLLKYKDSGWVSYLAVILVLLLLLPIIIMTFALMNPSEIEEAGAQSGIARVKASVLKLLNDLRLGISQMSFLVLLHSMTVFLSVSYLFGFAFAFHDRSVDGDLQIPPLYKAILPFHAKNQEPTNQIMAGTQPCYYLYFKDGASELEKENSDPNSVIVKKAVENGGSEAIERLRKNFKTFEDILVELNRISQSTKLIRITLIGHANDKSPGKDSPYQSNYQLSNARAEAIQDTITKEFYARNENKSKAKFEWSIRALSNEPLPAPTTLDEKICYNAKIDDRMVQISIRPVFEDPINQGYAPKIDFTRMDLMDYMYFSIYTITTTGYGDIVPTTTYAKFLTGLANICEVFFIVGFFNVFISFTERKQLRAEKKSTTTP